MSRIFDAMRKAEPRRDPEPEAKAPAPATPRAGPPPAPVTPLPTPSGHGAPPLPVRAAPVHAGVIATLPEHVAREMATLRVNLETGLSERVPRAVAFVSAQGGEGTSTVAAQFVIALASDPRTRVLFLDANAGRPALAAGVASHGPLAGLFSETVDARPAGTVDLLPVPEAARAAGVFAAAALEAALDAFGPRYDWIVLDGPPVLYSADSASISAIADGVVIVVEAGRTKKPVLTRSVDLLRKAGARVLGSVLNRRQLEIPEFIYRRI